VFEGASHILRLVQFEEDVALRLLNLSHFKSIVSSDQII
jgi:hypothetical protein